MHNIETLIGFEIPVKEKPTKEEVLAKKPSFDTMLRATPQIKKMKDDDLNKDIMKLRFNGGKKKKLRATNFVYAISNIEGVSAEDIGIITIQETLTYVEILNGKGAMVLDAMRKTKIGNKQLKVTRVKD